MQEDQDDESIRAASLFVSSRESMDVGKLGLEWLKPRFAKVRLILTSNAVHL